MGGNMNRVPGFSSGGLATAASRLRADVAFAVIDVVIVMLAYTVGIALRMFMNDPRALVWQIISWVVPLPEPAG